MVEVFKTNVQSQFHANNLTEQISTAFVDYLANFDLEDCDNILRIECKTDFIQSSMIINFIWVLL